MEKILLLSVVGVAILGTLVFIALQVRVPRTLDIVPKVEHVPADSQSQDSIADFFLDTSGDQGCVTNCPEVGLGVYIQKGDVRVSQLFRSCKHAAFGDVSGYVEAECDEERFTLKNTGDSVEVLQGNQVLLTLTTRS